MVYTCVFFVASIVPTVQVALAILPSNANHAAHVVASCPVASAGNSVSQPANFSLNVPTRAEEEPAVVVTTILRSTWEPEAGVMGSSPFGHMPADSEAGEA